MEPGREEEYCTCSPESTESSSEADTTSTEPMAPEPFELQEGDVQAVPEWPREAPQGAGPGSPTLEPAPTWRPPPPPQRSSGLSLGLDPRIWSPVARRQWEEAQRRQSLPGCSSWGQEDPTQTDPAPMVTDERFVCQEALGSSPESSPEAKRPEDQKVGPDPPPAPRKRRRVVLSEPEQRMDRARAISLLQKIKRDWPDLVPQAIVEGPVPMPSWAAEQKRDV